MECLAESSSTSLTPNASSQTLPPVLSKSHALAYSHVLQNDRFCSNFGTQLVRLYGVMHEMFGKTSKER